MKRTILARRAALAGAAVIAAVTLAACGSHDNGHNSGSGMPVMNHSSASSQPSATFNSADVMFAQMMIPHHQQAVEMATLAETRAADPQVKTLAAQIKAAQAPEIATMTKWLTAWGQPTAMPSGHDMGGMSHGMPGIMSDADMAKLKAATGTEFDKQFLQMMIEHHKGAIQMARDEQANGANPDAKALAARIIQTQQAEIDTMQKLLSQQQ
ncbi:MAG: hypothetical protein JWP76_810 [Dactylosporangium sp.]|jgi:uncharacterized protein (DUF305 family)|nr:hypothetical protein [Dactylosporangium sp.]